MYRYYQAAVDDEDKFQGFVCLANKNKIDETKDKKSWGYLEVKLSQKAESLGLRTHAKIITDKSVGRRK